MTGNKACVPIRAVRDFIPSDEVRSFLEAREHTFTLPEAALIIRRSRRPLSECMAAFAALCEQHLDHELTVEDFDGRHAGPLKWLVDFPCAGMHEFLRRWIAETQELDAQFRQNGEGAWYIFSVYAFGTWMLPADPYTDFSQCLRDGLESFKREGGLPDSDGAAVWIQKLCPNTDKHTVTAFFDEDGCLLCLEPMGGLDTEWFRFSFSIPFPFAVGDMLTEHWGVETFLFLVAQTPFGDPMLVSLWPYEDWETDSLDYLRLKRLEELPHHIPEPLWLWASKMRGQIGEAEYQDELWRYMLRPGYE